MTVLRSQPQRLADSPSPSLGARSVRKWVDAKGIRDLSRQRNRTMRLQEAEQLLGDRPKIRSVLLALTGTGWPAYAPALSAKVAALGMLVFACTPDQVPEPMATVLRRQDIAQWAANRDIKLIRADG